MNPATTPLTLTINRHFAAPPERIFAMWTDSPGRPEDFWGPRGFTLVRQASNPVPGGRWVLEMRSPDGEVMRNGGEYRVIERPHLIEMTHAWQDEAGHRTTPETVVRIRLSGSGDGCDMHFEQTGFDSVGERDGHGEGWSEAFDGLAALAERSA